MKNLGLTTIVLGLTCGGVFAYPVWNEQQSRLEDTNKKYSIIYNSIKDSDLLKKLLQDNDGPMVTALRQLVKDMDGDCMEFVAIVQSIKSLKEEISVAGALAKILGQEEISGATAIYIYQILFSEAGENLGRGFDEYVKAIEDPFNNEGEIF